MATSPSAGACRPWGAVREGSSRRYFVCVCASVGWCWVASASRRVLWTRPRYAGETRRCQLGAPHPLGNAYWLHGEKGRRAPSSLPLSAGCRAPAPLLTSRASATEPEPPPVCEVVSGALPPAAVGPTGTPATRTAAHAYSRGRHAGHARAAARRCARRQLADACV